MLRPVFPHPEQAHERNEVLRRLSATNSDTLELVAKTRQTIAQSRKLLATIDAMVARTWGAR